MSNIKHEASQTSSSATPLPWSPTPQASFSATPLPWSPTPDPSAFGASSELAMDVGELKARMSSFEANQESIKQLLEQLVG
ncbi:hypothetical protein L211DRAFT_837523 [Terfezia boudieri ATCC MYA-4762]|uniref:Uncharacterized protein n=1 Tax=Terfezia boudieri ATCC MYA-4762 TaxID=1051890 RepID=A0A3N4LTP3_9PEZI|nr:hypothetical protein L211DRAFT_837523 [Terfezia boudieri ATCC MYA-4762]